MWFDALHFQRFEHIRHSCEQGDDVESYGYNKHDGREYASQEINDKPSNMKIATEFIKISGGSHGGDWGVRISGTPIDDSVSSVTSVLFYVGIEGEGGLDIMSKLNRKGIHSPIVLEGDSAELGDFDIQITDGPLNMYPRDSSDEQDLHRTQWWAAVMKNIVDGARSRVTDMAKQQDLIHKPYRYLTLSNSLDEEGDEVANFYAFQKTFTGDFQFDVLFRSKSTETPITNEVLNAEILKREVDFNNRFEDTFHLSKKGFNQEEVRFGQYLLSNLLGGIGYFHGSSIVDRSHPPMEDEEEFHGEPVQPVLTPPQTLFTATPSRPFFPRGFYWDEGFHQLLIGTWDNDLSVDILSHWVSLIDENGWVAREQILGEEARSKVPPEFQTQFPHYANPPTIYMAIKRFIDRLDKASEVEPFDIDRDQMIMSTTEEQTIVRNLHLDNHELAIQWLRSIYPKLRKNWLWFRSTQHGHLEKFGRTAPSNEAYRWRGRTVNHTLTSGLDDYPRGEPSIGELHVDLHSWMAYVTGLLKDISSKLGSDYHTDVQEYTSVQRDILLNLDVLHWNDENKMYCDQALEDNNPIHICHKGYISLFPMMLGLLPPNSPKLEHILNMIGNESELWTPYGLRSLSASDDFFSKGENYWRGPIWININYLTLQSLYRNYIHVPGPHQAHAKTIYIQLRDNIIKNVYKNYRKTGYVWENYAENDGHGMGSHPFTGWSSLVLLIMAEDY
ncbi:glycoside hydrolase [Pilobolus umbonatus]|nr:glycoside hydrolase [Pilobolus umbonatus]